MQPYVVTLFTDPTPDGYINQRLVVTILNMCRQTDLNPDEQKAFDRNLLLVAKKLVATWSHYSRYCAIEDHLIGQAKHATPPGEATVPHFTYSQDLYIEMDEFLVQVKSTLDYLTKLPLALFKTWPYMHGFGDKGGAVIKALKNNIPRKHRHQAELLERSLFTKHRPWLEMAITARDKVIHNLDGGLEFESFVVAKQLIDDEERIVVPMWMDDMSARQYMEYTFYNLFALVEQFIGGLLGMRLQEGLGFAHVPTDIKGIVSPLMIVPAEALEALRSKWDAEGVAYQLVEPYTRPEIPPGVPTSKRRDRKRSK